MKKQPTINLIIYLTLSTFFLYFSYINNYLIKVFPHSSFIFPLLIGLLIILLTILIPIKHINVNNTSIIKNVFLSLYYIVFNSILLTNTCNILIYYFYPNISFLLLSILLILIIFLFALFQTKQLFDVSLLIYIIIIMSNFVIIFNTSIPNFNILYNIKNTFQLKFDFILFIPLLFMLLEPLCLMINCSKENVLNIKKTIILSTLISSVLATIFIFLNYLFYNSTYLTQLSFPSFAFLTSFLGPEFLDHFQIIILPSTLAYSLLKISLNVSLVSSNFDKPKVIILVNSILIFIITNIMYRYTSSKSFIILFLILLLNFIPLIFNKKEGYHETSPT